MKQHNLLNFNMIKLSTGFSRSTNIEFDYKDSTKLNNIFITSKFGQEIVNLLNSILDENSRQRVKVLSGSPGLGKSTFALFAANLVSKKNPRIIKKKILLNNNEKKIIYLFELFQRSKKTKLLPVFLNGYMGNIEDAFVDKLYLALTEIGLDKQFNDIAKNISKDQLSIVQKWKKSFPEIYDRYCLLLDRECETPASFEKKLKKGKIETRDFFELIYSEITGGASSSNGRSDVIGLYKKCTELLKENGYAGIYIVYDEFGKYLEKGVHNPSLLNVQFLQDFAEYCDRSGENAVPSNSNNSLIRISIRIKIAIKYPERMEQNRRTL